MANAQRLRDRHDAPLARAGQTAIILNKNAKRVTEKVRQRIVEGAPNADVFFTESLEQASFVARRVVDSGYATVVTGGGDGTVANTIREILDQSEQHAAGRRPKFAVLKLGTGNAVADFLGSGAYADDLAALDQAETRPVQLLRIDGQRAATFAGFGWDAHILNDYQFLKNAAERFFLTRALFQTAAGYVAAGLGKSVPVLLFKRPSWHVKVTNTGEMAFLRDRDGRICKRYAPGEVVFEGDARLACFGTTPYYGFKFKIMPYADRTPGMFHLRLVNIHPMAAIANLRRIWNGTSRMKGVTDLQMSACRLDFDRDAPFQISGDAEGMRRSVDVTLDTPFECVHFNR